MMIKAHKTYRYIKLKCKKIKHKHNKANWTRSTEQSNVRLELMHSCSNHFSKTCLSLGTNLNVPLRTVSSWSAFLCTQILGAKTVVICLPWQQPRCWLAVTQKWASSITEPYCCTDACHWVLWLIICESVTQDLKYTGWIFHKQRHIWWEVPAWA